MSAGDVGKVVWVDEVVYPEGTDLHVGEPEDLPPPGVEGNDPEVELVLGLEHDLLLWHLEEGGWPEGGTDAEEGQRGVLGLTVLAVEGLDLPPYIQSLINQSIK